jgi:enoyl-CoA hydratase/carnithine racemase
LLRSRLPHAEHHQAIVLGKRYTAEEALSAKIVNEVCPVEELKAKAIAAGHRLTGKDGLNRRVLSSIKYDMYRDTYRSLMEPVRFYSNL